MNWRRARGWLSRRALRRHPERFVGRWVEIELRDGRRVRGLLKDTRRSRGKP